ncbi:MAG: dihydrolipoamide acetyltransferase [Rubripirellula sp.]
MADEAEAPETEETPAEAAASGGGGKGLIIAFVAMVVLMETAMFFFLVPSAEEVSALAEAKLIKSVQDGAAAAEEQESDENMVKEFALGMYGEAFSPIDTERTYRVEINLYGLIRKKNHELMSSEFESKEGRLRHAIRMKIRNSALEELNENNLGLLERRILTECNHLLEDDLLLGIGFKSYQLIEQ